MLPTATEACMDILTNFLQQIGFSVGILVVFGFLIALCRRAMYRNIGDRAMLVLGIVGIPIHELSHALMCLLFGHKIIEVKFFIPGSQDGTLGYVNHSCNPRNPYQRIGRFFISVAPILCGTGILILLMRLLVPDVFTGVAAEFASISGGMGAGTSGMNVFLEAFRDMILRIFDPVNVRNYRWWIFLVLALMISSHMELSGPDIKNSFRGFLPIAVLLLVADIVMYFAHLPALRAVTAAITSFSVYIATFLSIALIFCAAMVVLTFAVRCLKLILFRR